MPYIAGTNNAWSGSGLGSPLQFAGVPTNGVGGTYANQNAGPGAVLINTATGVLYQNTGTSASPTWTKVSAE